MTAEIVFWLVMMAVFLIVELATVGLVSVWFVAGSLGAMIVAALNGSLWLQVAVFVIVSAVLLASLRPFMKKFVTPKKIKTNMEALIGQTAVVTCAIDNVRGAGAVKIGGAEWSARSVDGRNIEVDQLVRVERIEGVKAVVMPVEAAVAAEGGA